MITLLKSVSKAKQLAKTLGGKWKYDGVGAWWCDDKKRHVARVAGCSCDDECEHPPRYYLYGDGIPKMIRFYGTEIKLL